MDQPTIVEACCAFCHSIYKVPLEYLGKRVTCKKCGNLFELNRRNGGEESSILGKLALKYKFVDAQQLAQALSAIGPQAPETSDAALEAYFIQKGQLSAKQLHILHAARDYLKIRIEDKERGNDMIEAGLCTQAQVETVLAEQAREFKERQNILRLDDLLIRSGALSQEQYAFLQKAGGHSADQLHAPDSGADSGSAVARSGNDADSIMRVSVSEDRLTALLTFDSLDGGSIDLESVKHFLKQHKIVYGLLQDSLLESSVVREAKPGTPIVVARGTPPTPGTEPVIHYHFDADFFKTEASRPGEGVRADAGDQPPAATPGALIAEKVPPVPGTAGTDVHGNSIPPAEIRDIQLRCGAGAKLSEDGLRVYAEVDGGPKVSIGGQIEVLPVLRIPGDVDQTTGEIDCKGHIVVDGAVKQGVRIRGGSLTADEISGADVAVSGDVKISGGIVGACVRAQGAIHAKYIKNATLAAYGDVRAEKEITDSEIISSGACRIPYGVVLSSVISAKRGIVAHDVGTEVSNPSRLRPGVDDHVETELASLREQLTEKKKDLTQLESDRRVMESAHEGLHIRIAELAQVQDRALIQQRALKERKTALAGKGQQEAAAKIDSAIADLDGKLKDAEATIGKLFEEQDALSEQLKAASDQIHRAEAGVEELKSTLRRVLDWADQDRKDPTVKVSGSIMEGTLIAGMKAQKILKNTCNNVLITEIRKKGAGVDDQWEIRIIPQRKESVGSPHTPSHPV